MAQENVKTFYEKLMESDELKAKLKVAAEAYTGDKSDQEKVAEEIIIPLAKEAGLPFTIEELKAAEEAMRAERELNEDELSAVAGGKGGCIIWGAGNAQCFLYGIDRSDPDGKNGFCIGIGIFVK